MIYVTKPDLPPIEDYNKYIKKIWRNRWLTNSGTIAQLFEKNVQKYLKVRNLVVVANGTLALQIALRALKLKGEVITTPFTFATTTNVLVWEGIIPVFVDIDPETFNIDPAKIEERISPKTTGILATHIYGNPCYVDALAKMASKYSLKLVFDAAHAFGVEYSNNSILNYGDISTLSFHATKVFTTGEGGAIVLNNTGLLKTVRLLIDHGIISEERILLPGINAKLNELQAAMGLCNLKYINDNILSRKKRYDLYKELLSGAGIGFQKLTASKYNYSYMPICLNDSKHRDLIYTMLLKKGVKTRKYFFPLTARFEYLSNKGRDLVKYYNLKFADDIANRILCLPIYSDLDISVVEDVCKIVLGKYLKRLRQ